MNQKVRVLIRTDDQTGLVYRVSKVFYDLGLNIESNREFVDNISGKFFMRSVVAGQPDPVIIHSRLKQVLPASSFLKVVIPKKKKLVILCTKESHALGDILIRHEAGELEAGIQAVVANHNNLKDLVDRFNIPFHHLPSDDISREGHENQLVKLIDTYQPDYIILAKYMRILTETFVKRFERKIINIHHSFLPAFAGANPYKQAYERGVKIIGATAHFVTSELDEGPIIAQDVIPVDHRYDWKEMQRAGRDVEKIVLSKALSLVLNDRVFIYKNKTIVF
jgi:formyltetrahydrofolate deformylase